MAANVNRPTNVKEKEADVNRKLQIYGIINAFQNGKAPSNDQIDVALNSFLESKALSHPHEDLSDDGKQLIRDVREVIKQSKNLVLSKNEGNLLQNFIWQTTQFDPKSIKAPDAPISKDSAKRDGDDALQGLRTLGTLIITNGQFRKILKDATILLRDMAGDAASTAASKVKPSEEQLQDIDRPAENNTWHDAPDLSKDSLMKQAKGFYGGDAKKDAQDIVNAGIGQVPEGEDPKNTDQAAVAGALKTSAKDKVDKNVDTETKEKIKQRNEEYRRRAREYINKKVPQERREQVIYRLKKGILECQQHPDYSEAIQTLLLLAEQYGEHGVAYSKSTSSSAKEARTGFAAAEADLRTLIERFANGTSTSNLWAAISQIYKDADKDAELKGWFKKIDSYIRRCLLEQGYILDDASTKEWDALYEQGEYLLRNKYRSHTDNVVDELKFIADQFDKDPQNQAFGQACQQLFTHLGNDENGTPVFKPHLVKDLTNIILPSILKNTSYIPVPRIEYSDPQFDAIIENLVLESDNFMPNVTEIASEHYFRWGRKKISNKNTNTIDVKVSGVQMDLRDVSFHIKRKSGFPSITDTGVADILLPGEGFSFRMKVSTASKTDRQNFFKVDKVDVDFKGLKLKIKESKHKLLFAIAKPIALKAVRPALQKAVEKAIKDKCNKLDTFLFQIKQEADRALEEAKANPENTPNIYQRYYEAAQKRFLQGKEKAKATVEDKKVNVAMTKEDSIFPNISLPGGVSSKATEYKELARKGDKWESPVFSIGNAKKSSDAPSAPKIEQKTRSAAVSTNGSIGGAVNAAANGAANGHTNGHLNNGHLNNGHLNGKAVTATPLGAIPLTGTTPVVGTHGQPVQQI